MQLTLESRHYYQTLLSANTLTKAKDTPAIVYLHADDQPPTVVSQVDFCAQSERYASALSGLGVQADDLVIIAHLQTLESIYAFWGCLLIGAVPSMFPTLTEKLDPQKYFEDMALLVKLSEAQAIFTTVDFSPALRMLSLCPVYDVGDIENAGGNERVSRSPAPDSVAFLQHSSGTTGLQKGVALSHRAVLNQLASYSTALQLSNEDVIVSWLPLYHDMGLIAGFLLPIMQGIPLVLMSPFDWVRQPAMLFKAISTFGGTLTWLPNFAYNHCVHRIRQRQLEGIDLRSMRAFINCSEPVHHTSHEAFYERFQDYGLTRHHLQVSYAMAENTFAVTQTPLGQPPQIDVVNRHLLEHEGRAEPVEASHPNAVELVACGPPIAHVEAKCIDQQGQVVPERHVGEIAIKSNSMLTGFYKRSDLNKNLLTDGWYKTGDMGYKVDGVLYLMGRKKDLIISGGKNVYPQDLETIVNKLELDGLKPGRNVAFGVWDEKEGTELIAIVAEAEVQTDDQRRAIIRHIRRAIGEQSSVTANYVTLVDPQWLLKTSSGKIARAANRDKWIHEYMGANH